MGTGWRARAGLAALAWLAVAGCGAGTVGVSPGTVSPGTVGESPTPRCAVTVPGFSCLMQGRIASARRYLATAPGRIGLVLRDRETGAVWRNSRAGEDFHAASTIKLAMVTDLLERAAAGTLSLTPADRALMSDALRSSSDVAADLLWNAYEDAGFLRRIRSYGMTGASFTTGPYWGSVTCSPADLSALMGYVLTRLPPGDRGYIVSEMRHVAPNQHWGVWGAGPASRPGTKNGWVDIAGAWTVDTVGFAGPGARYTLAIMDSLGGAAGFTAGADALTQVAAILFQGHRIPAPEVSATP